MSSFTPPRFHKSFIFVAAFMMAASLANAQGPSVTANMYNYNGGNQISCHGVSDGSINITVSGGATPYGYLWSNSATTQNLSSIAAGTYTVTVTDANSATATASATLIEPAALSASLSDVQKHGYDISCKNGNDGAITNTILGGTANYSYLWNTMATTQNLTNVIAGTYHVTVTDANSCTATGVITMTEPAIISSSVSSPTLASGFNTSCGLPNGTVTLTVSGGVSTYTYSWNSGQTTQNLSGVPGGLYAVVITDLNGCTKNNVINVSTPPVITTVNDSITVYLNNANISCDTCHDGVIKALPVGGTTPYTYQWAPPPYNGTTQTISGLAALVSGASVQYSVTVTDAAGCTKDFHNITLIPAGSNDWTITGNHGNSGFIGTLDSVDFVVKTKATERMRINAIGDVDIKRSLKIDSLGFNDTSSTVYRILGADPHGNIKSLQSLTVFPGPSVSTCSPIIGWGLPSPYCTTGNSIIKCPTDGFVGIGIDNPLYTLDVKGIIHSCEVLVDYSNCPDYVFDKDYNLISIKDLESYIFYNHHLPEIPSAKLMASTSMNLGDMNGKHLQKVEEQTLYIINLQKQIDELKVAIQHIKK